MASNSKANASISNGLISGVKRIVSRRKTPWVGTMSDLYATLEMNVANEVYEEFPGSPSALRLSINKIIRRLNRNEGIRISFTRTTDSSRTRLVEISVR